MGKTLLLYTSLTGNTELMTDAVIEQLEQNDQSFIKKSFEVDSIDIKELFDYDIILIGLYTWIDGDLPFEVEDFYDELYDIDLSGKVFGVFGSADRAYERYGTAVEMMYDQLEKLGATMIPDKIISDMDPSDKELERCKQLVNNGNKMIG